MPESVHRLAGPGDPRIALYRAVSDPDLARSHGLFVAEGRLVVRRVVEDSRYLVHSMLLNEAAYRELAPILERAAAPAPVFLADTSDFEAVTGINIHRGCLALVHRPAPMLVSGVVAASHRLLVLDGVANADNVGALFRNAAAFGVNGVVLSPDCCDPLYRKAIRTSMAAVLRVPFVHSANWPGDLIAARNAGFTLAALTPRAPAEDLEAFALRLGGSRVALILGAEGSGVTPLVESIADARVRIPIDAGIDSLNVAVAAGIALHRLGLPAR